MSVCVFIIREIFQITPKYETGYGREILAICRYLLKKQNAMAEVAAPAASAKKNDDSGSFEKKGKRKLTRDDDDDVDDDNFSLDKSSDSGGGGDVHKRTNYNKEYCDADGMFYGRFQTQFPKFAKTQLEAPPRKNSLHRQSDRPTRAAAAPATKEAEEPAAAATTAAAAATTATTPTLKDKGGHPKQGQDEQKSLLEKFRKSLKNVALFKSIRDGGGGGDGNDREGSGGDDTNSFLSRRIIRKNKEKYQPYDNTTKLTSATAAEDGGGGGDYTTSFLPKKLTDAIATSTNPQTVNQNYPLFIKRRGSQTTPDRAQKHNKNDQTSIEHSLQNKNEEIDDVGAGNFDTDQISTRFCNPSPPPRDPLIPLSIVNTTPAVNAVNKETDSAATVTAAATVADTFTRLEKNGGGSSNASTTITSTTTTSPSPPPPPPPITTTTTTNTTLFFHRGVQQSPPAPVIVSTSAAVASSATNCIPGDDDGDDDDAAAAATATTSTSASPPVVFTATQPDSYAAEVLASDDASAVSVVSKDTSVFDTTVSDATEQFVDHTALSSNDKLTSSLLSPSSSLLRRLEESRDRHHHHQINVSVPINWFNIMPPPANNTYVNENDNGGGRSASAAAEAAYGYQTLEKLQFVESLEGRDPEEKEEGSTNFIQQPPDSADCQKNSNAATHPVMDYSETATIDTVQVSCNNSEEEQVQQRRQKQTLQRRQQLRYTSSVFPPPVAPLHVFSPPPPPPMPPQPLFFSSKYETVTTAPPLDTAEHDNNNSSSSRVQRLYQQQQSFEQTGKCCGGVGGVGSGGSGGDDNIVRENESGVVGGGDKFFFSSDIGGGGGGGSVDIVGDCTGAKISIGSVGNTGQRGNDGRANGNGDGDVGNDHRTGDRSSCDDNDAPDMAVTTTAAAAAGGCGGGGGGGGGGGVKKQTSGGCGCDRDSDTAAQPTVILGGGGGGDGGDDGGVFLSHEDIFNGGAQCLLRLATHLTSDLDDKLTTEYERDLSDIVQELRDTEISIQRGFIVSPEHIEKLRNDVAKQYNVSSSASIQYNTEMVEHFKTMSSSCFPGNFPFPNIDLIKAIDGLENLLAQPITKFKTRLDEDFASLQKHIEIFHRAAVTVAAAREGAAAAAAETVAASRRVTPSKPRPSPPPLSPPFKTSSVIMTEDKVYRYDQMTQRAKSDLSEMVSIAAAAALQDDRHQKAKKIVRSITARVNGENQRMDIEPMDFTSSSGCIEFKPQKWKGDESPKTFLNNNGSEDEMLIKSTVEDILQANIEVVEKEGVRDGRIDEGEGGEKKRWWRQSQQQQQHEKHRFLTATTATQFSCRDTDLTLAVYPKLLQMFDCFGQQSLGGGGGGAGGAGCDDSGENGAAGGGVGGGGGGGDETNQVTTVNKKTHYLTHPEYFRTSFPKKKKMIMVAVIVVMELTRLILHLAHCRSGGKGRI